MKKLRYILKISSGKRVPYEQNFGHCTNLSCHALCRFGVKDDFKCVKEKCIFAKLRIVSPSGEELGPRTQDDK